MKIVMVLIIGLLGLLAACAPRPVPVAPEEPKSLPAEVGKQSWEVEWEPVKEKARREGKVVLYTTAGTDLREVLARGMKEYGIELEAVSGRGTDLVERIKRQRRSGIYDVDLYMAGLSLHLILKADNAFAPLESLLILPELKDPKVWYKGVLPFLDKEKQYTLGFEAFVDYGIHINTDMVKPGDIKSMQDLLSPRWKGKIVMLDPKTPGRGNKWTAVVSVLLGEDYVRQLARQNPVISSDKRQPMDWVAKGKYAIGLGISSDLYMEYKGAGAPVDQMPMKEVEHLLAGLGIISYLDKAPHPNASRVFLNWLLSREAQAAWLNIRGTQSARLDTPVDHLKARGDPVLEPGMDIYDTRGEEWETQVRPKGEKVILEVF